MRSASARLRSRRATSKPSARSLAPVARPTPPPPPVTSATRRTASALTAPLVRRVRVRVVVAAERGLVDVLDGLEVRNLVADRVLDAHPERHEARGAGPARAMQLQLHDLALVRHELAVAPVPLEVGADLLEDRLDLVLVGGRGGLRGGRRLVLAGAHVVLGRGNSEYSPAPGALPAGRPAPPTRGRGAPPTIRGWPRSRVFRGRRRRGNAPSRCRRTSTRSVRRTSAAGPTSRGSRARCWAAACAR